MKLPTRHALTLATLATLALPCMAGLASPAARADTAGTIPIGRDGVAGTFQAAGEQQTWAVQLKAGVDYALAVNSGDGVVAPVPIMAAGGAVLCTGYGGYGGGGVSFMGGCSFRAPYSGLYTVSATAAEGDTPPVRYFLRVM